MPSFVHPYSASHFADRPAEALRVSASALLMRCARRLLGLHQARLDRDIARVIERHGGLTDDAEREISRRFGSLVS
jgi:hypothetical protein